MRNKRTVNSEQLTGNREQGLCSLHGLLLLLVVVFARPTITSAQQIDLGNNGPVAAKKQHVFLLSAAVEVAAGSPQVVELQFRVEPGFHINSHTPKDELLIPTALKLEESSGVKIAGAEYPAGTAFRLGSGADAETLDVYQGDFRVRLRLVAPRGESALIGTLRYQACDNAACFPPRSLPVRVLVRAK